MALIDCTAPSVSHIFGPWKILFWCKFTSRSHGQNCFLEMFTARLAIYHYWLFKMEFIQESFFSSVACSESPSKTCFFLGNSASAYLQHGSGFKNFFWFLRGYVILLLHSHQLYVLHTHGNDISVNSVTLVSVLLLSPPYIPQEISSFRPRLYLY